MGDDPARDETLGACREALGRGDWTQAGPCFERALSRDGESTEALED